MWKLEIELKRASDETLLRIERLLQAEMLDRERREVLTDALNRFAGFHGSDSQKTVNESLTELEATWLSAR